MPFAFFFIACCLLLSSCASSKPKPTSDGYLTVLEKWTREGKIYDNFETRLIVKATYKSEEFRKAYVSEYSRYFMLDEAKVNKLMSEELGASKGSHEFFVSAHSPFVEWSDLERKPPVWSIFLANDMGDRVAAVDIRRLKDRLPGENKFYPYFDDWSKGYTVRFPLTLPDGKGLITENTKYVNMIITGPLGKLELVWELKNR